MGSSRDAGRDPCLPSAEALAEDLYVLGGVAEIDGRLSWAPPTVRGHAPINAYLIQDPTTPTLIDTGVALHRDAILSGLDETLETDEKLSVFLTRSEYECIGNIGAVAASRGIDALYAGGASNPFDAFDDIAATAWLNRIRLGRVPFQERLRLPGSERIDVVAPPIRTLATYWAYDVPTRTLFTSDLFGHGITQEAPTTRLITKTPPALDEKWVRDMVLAKFWWLAVADQIAVVRRNFDQLFELCDVEIIAPTHGMVFVGREVVERQRELLDDVLRDLERSASTHDTGRRPQKPVDHASEGPAQHSAITTPTSKRTLPRQIAPGIHWLGPCVDGGSVNLRGGMYHSHLSLYALIGREHSLLVDTGLPSGWPTLERELDQVFGDRAPTWIFPTHPEFPHSGNLQALLDRYPEAQVIGDMRDYHLFFPGIEARSTHVTPGHRLDLGGLSCEFVPAMLKDLPSTLWLYEATEQVLFAADGFSYFHRQPETEDEEEDDVPVHLAGECGLFVSELDSELDAEQAVMIIANALSWSRYVDAEPLFEIIEAFLVDHPVRLIAPAHGNLIDDVERTISIIREAHDAAFAGASFSLPNAPS
ncbi:MAG TPA: MBL fold metallo-hydrolase [Solirubrobacterales bacterium]|jgi:flavorubredoxin|nr:MBL fold metallo-hydrolase [Solirubrobacterales bacterium]